MRQRTESPDHRTDHAIDRLEQQATRLEEAVADLRAVLDKIKSEATCDRP